MSARRLKDLATRYQVLLERLKTGEVQDFNKVFAQIDKIIRDVLGELDDPNLGNLSKKQLNTMLINLREENSAVLSKATAHLFDNTLAPLAAYSVKYEADSLLDLSSKLPLQMISGAQAYTDALANPISATGDLLNSFVDNWSDNELLRINNAVQKAWGEGQTVQELMQSIRGTKALNFKDGILEMGRRDAAAIARTSIQAVANSSRKSLWDANSDIVTSYVWVSTLDSRTSQICRSLDGQVFKLDKGPTPPAHINCRSTTRAELDKSLDLDFLDEDATRSSADGYVDAKETYYSWLGDQPDEFQDEALGPTRAQLFRDGGLSADKFAALQLDKNFQPLTLTEMQKLQPKAFARAGINQ